MLVFARSSRGLHDLQAQLRNHTMDRRYVAVVEGDVFGDAGTFDADLVEDRGDRRRGVAKPGTKGTRAVTEWKVLERFGLATLVEVRLKTGRTHQIRVHLAHVGHPVLGDPQYGRRAGVLGLTRQFLHAYRLGLRLPTSGEYLEFESPLPEDLAAVLEKLRKRLR